MDKKILIEAISPSSQPLKIVEGVDNGKRLFLEGIAIQGEVKNFNGRIYPKSEIERAVEQVNEKIKLNGPIIGECDHPDGLNINLDRATHMIREMKMVGNDGHAKFEVVPVGLGEIIAGFIRHGARLGVSSRGSGNVDHKGIVSDFDIVTIDVVANPSAPDAYPKPIYESLQRTRQGLETLSLAEAIRHDPKAQSHFEKSLLTFIQSIDPRKHNG